MNQSEEDRQLARKARLRGTAIRRRQAQPDREALSVRICTTLRTLPEYRDAETICSYVGVGSEVLTWDLLREAMAAGKKVVVPYVDQSRLALSSLCDPTELGPAPFGLLEPSPELRDQQARQTYASAVDLFVVPGLAFDSAGARLGYGKGYYDNLLDSAPAEAQRVGLAFACQIVPRLPTLGYDVSMHVVITEDAVYRLHVSP
jgi:5-formyltetrahydrofolate cyclo-ligase